MCRPVKKSDGATTSLSAFVGEKPCVVFFYPKAGTPVCTKEACKARASVLILLDLSHRLTKFLTPCFVWLCLPLLVHQPPLNITTCTSAHWMSLRQDKTPFLTDQSSYSNS